MDSQYRSQYRTPGSFGFLIMHNQFIYLFNHSGNKDLSTFKTVRNISLFKKLKTKEKVIMFVDVSLDPVTKHLFGFVGTSTGSTTHLLRFIVAVGAY